MADRKQFQNVTAPDPELMRLLAASRNTPVTEEELREQRISFAFGNAPDSKLITKDSVRLASKNIRLLPWFSILCPFEKKTIPSFMQKSKSKISCGSTTYCLTALKLA